MSRLIRLYPESWRARYQAEFLALLDERPPSLFDRLDIVRGAVDAQIHSQITEDPQVDQGRAGRRGAGMVAASGGVLWVLAGLGFHGAPFIDYLGYKDSGSVVLLAAAAAALTGLAALMVTRRMAERSVPLSISTAAILVGSIGLALPWPILIVGFFSVLLGTVVFGMVGTRELGPAYVLVGVGALLALGFNTEDSRALLMVPLGLAWLIVGIATFRDLSIVRPRPPIVGHAEAPIASRLGS